MMRKLRIDDVVDPPGSAAIISGCVTAPEAINNPIDTMQ